MPAKADKLTTEQRIEAVYRLILDGWTVEQIVENGRKAWGLKDAMAYRYIEKAWQRIEAVAAPERTEHHRRAVAAHYQMLREAKTVKDKLAVWAALSRLYGLDAPKVIHVIPWQDEIVELLRRGELMPDDVEAAYPDLAGEFFTRAGIVTDANRND